MAFQYIEAPNYDQIQNPNNSIFLAGGITKVQDWQKKVTDALREFDSVTVINPRRENFEMFKNDSTFQASLDQIKWEHKYLRLAKQVAFWFSYETVQPISLFELGATIERNKQQIVVGVHEKYVRNFDVKIQLELQGYPQTQVIDSFDKFIEVLVIDQRNIRRSLLR